MEESLLWLYLIIGLAYGIYDWISGTKDDYEKAEKENNIESPMFTIYWIMMIVAWPFIMFIKILRKIIY